MLRAAPSLHSSPHRLVEGREEERGGGGAPRRSLAPLSRRGTKVDLKKSPIFGFTAYTTYTLFLHSHARIPTRAAHARRVGGCMCAFPYTTAGGWP